MAPTQSPLTQSPQPATPEPAYAKIAESPLGREARLESENVDSSATNMTPPPSSQPRASSQRGKTRTPTPTISQISTPPPTVEVSSNSMQPRAHRGATNGFSLEDIASATEEQLRTGMMDLQAALHEARMSAAHHKLQYQMLAQESAASLERMAVEARMVQYEHEVLHSAEQAKAAASVPTPVQSSPLLPEGTIPVQKELYQRMCREIQQLTDEKEDLLQENAAQDKLLQEQEYQIEQLNDKVTLLRERIRESRDNNRNRLPGGMDSTPRSSAFATPLRHGVASHEQPQPFAALLQASEMASQEARRPGGSFKKGHNRNTHSMSSLPVTPSRNRQQTQYFTPQGRQAPFRVPATAPVARTTLHAPEVYSQARQQQQQQQPSFGALSDGTVSMSDRGNDEISDEIVDDISPDQYYERENDNADSEAETDIVDPDSEQTEIAESQASRAASQMLRAVPGGREAQRLDLQGRGMLRYPQSIPQTSMQQQQQQRVSQVSSSSGGVRGGMTQTTLFGNVRKPVGGATAREDVSPSKKRRRTGPAPVGLGIAGVRQ